VATGCDSWARFFTVLAVVSVCSGCGNSGGDGLVRQPKHHPFLHGYLVFASGEYSQYGQRVLVMRADGSGFRPFPRIRQNVRNSDAEDWDPAWSKDGRFLAFTSTRAPPPPGNNDVYVMDVATGKTRDVSGDRIDDWEPAWSRDGKRIAFQQTRECQERNGVVVVPCTGGMLMTVNADGSNLRRLHSTYAGSARPSWSPDGRRIAFSTPAGGTAFHDVFVINSDGTGLRNLTKTTGVDDYEPAWSPDGKRIAFACGFTNARVCVMNADGTNRHVLSPASLADTNPHPSWSPDGRWIAFTDSFNYPLSVDGIWVVRADGKRLLQVRANEDSGYANVDWTAASPLPRGRP
jgi:TolB protein